MPIKISQIFNYHVNIYKSFLLWICAICAFLAMNPYFMWNTYLNGSFNILRQFVLLITFLTMLFYYFYMRRISIKIIVIGNSFVLIWILQRVSGGIFNFAFGSVLTILIISMFVNLSDENKKAIYEKFVTIFALSLISGIVVWFITTIGINIPYSELISDHQGKVAAGFYYKHHFGSIYLSNIYFTMMQRLCGMFDEPGVVGTFSALILVGNRFGKRKDWKNVVIFIAGILSFSLAFWLILIVAYLIWNFKKGLTHIIASILVLSFIYFIFININTNIEYINTLQSRMTIVNGTLAGNSRSDEPFDIAFNIFLKGNDGNRLFGNGINAAQNNPAMFGSYTYKMLIYDYGFLGFTALILWFLLTILKLYKKNWNCLTLLFVFLISIYQRPYVFELYYIIVLFGGCATINLSQSNIININKKQVISKNAYFMEGTNERIKAN